MRGPFGLTYSSCQSSRAGGRSLFDYTLLHWSGFLTAAVLLNLSPGPDMAFILGQTLGNIGAKIS